jgi:hypothetical protein
MIRKKFMNEEISGKLLYKNKLPVSCSLCQIGCLNKCGHIIPELILRWTRKKSGKDNFFFYPIQPEFFDALKELIDDNNGFGLAVSDLLKYKMLCDCCEQKLSDYEKHFTDKYFKRYYRGHEVGELDDSTYLLIISIAWRVLISTKIMVGQEALSKISLPFEKDIEDILYLNKFPGGDFKYGPDVSYFTVEDLKEFFARKKMSTGDIDYSIEQNICAHHIFDKKLPKNHNRMSLFEIPVVYLKLGRYYFVINYYNYFDDIDFVIDRKKIDDNFNLFKFTLNEDLLSFINFMGNNRVHGIENYKFKAISFTMRTKNR